jgi:succinyl-CoA synthetase beta subunit
VKIHEYQGKQLFAKYGVPIPKGYPAFSVDEAEAQAKKLIDETKSDVVVVKAQIHAGGRGKGGGVKVAKGGAAEARQLAEKILGMQLVTHQTGPEGQKVRRLYIEQGLAMEREMYLGAVVDRDRRRIAFMASTEGGVEIEKVAEETPEKIMTVHVDPVVGLSPYQSRKLAFGLGLEKHGKETVGKFVKLMAVGCLVNGAGLAMATMDIIKHYGKDNGVAPANFLDVGGGATQEQVTKAFKMILRSPKVKAIFVNIFGGIMKCDVIASGVVAAAKELGLKVPLVVRLEGTNVELGRKILSESGLKIEAATTMADGAAKIVAAVTGK